MRRWYNNKEVYRHRSYDYRRKKFPIWWIILIVIVLIAIVYAYDIGGLKTSTSKIFQNINLLNSSKSQVLINLQNTNENKQNNYELVSDLDLIHNPQNYLNRLIKINSASVGIDIASDNSSNHYTYYSINTREEDGSWVNFRYIYYKGDLLSICGRPVDLYGEVFSDSYGYYFNVTRAICKF